MTDEQQAFENELNASPMIRALVTATAEFVNRGERGTRERFLVRLK